MISHNLGLKAVPCTTMPRNVRQTCRTCEVQQGFDEELSGDSDIERGIAAPFLRNTQHGEDHQTVVGETRDDP